MKKKYHAIRIGRKTGVFHDTWSNIQQYVDGFPGAEFKSFTDPKDAESFLHLNPKNETVSKKSLYSTLKAKIFKPSEEKKPARIAIPNDIKVQIDNGRNILIHGKAGTGKSTILREICQYKKNAVVLAPTGIASINIMGQTIHSFFGFKTGYLSIENVKVAFKRLGVLNKKPILIIDEISMVRSDVFNAIDKCLQVSLKNEAPFGGLQLILLGDTGQLSPVVTNQESELFNNDEAFFHAKAFTRGWFVSIELVDVYRQKDKLFIDYLSKIRTGDISIPELNDFNDRLSIKNSDESIDCIVLSPTNSIADSFNKRMYDQIVEKEFVYLANIIDQFNDKSFPADKYLKLKKGAKIILIKNDKDGRWVNGTLAIIERLTDTEVHINIAGKIFSLKQERWEQYSYELKEGKIHKSVVGAFEQYPIKLAWAITIHKSQGMTLNKIHLDLSNPTFAHGQMYVALSRATTLAGISLTRRIQMNDIRIEQRLIYKESANKR